MDIIAVQSNNQLYPINNIQKLEIERTLNGGLQLSLKIINDKSEGYNLVREFSIISVNDLDFRVLELAEDVNTKTVSALSTFYDLSTTRRNSTFGGSRTFSEFLNFTLEGTGWNSTFDFNNESRLITDFGNASIVALVRVLSEQFNCEFEIRGNNTIHFSRSLGGYKGKQYRYKHNVNNVIRKSSVANLRTRITGYGANGLQVTYTSPNSQIFGIREAEDVTDDRFESQQSLLTHLESIITDVPEISIDVNTVEFGGDTSIGERVWLIYEPMNIEFETRIIKQTTSIRNRKLAITKVTLGNQVIQSATDLLSAQKIEIDSNKKEYRSRIEQTNELIEFQVAELNGSLSNLSIRADEIQSNVIQVENGLTTAQSQILQTANQLQFKVTVGQSISDINLSEGNATINADKINLNGAVIANGSITGNGNLDITNDIRVGNNIYLAQQRNSDSKAIIFNNTSRINADAFNMNISAPTIIMGSRVIFVGSVDFSNATVTGLPTAPIIPPRT